MTDRKFGVEIELIGTTEGRAIRTLREAGLNVHDYTDSGYDNEYDEDEDGNEIPLSRDIHADSQSYWKIVDDGSVDEGGFEVVSPILCGTEGLAEVTRAARALASIGATANRSCGLHVHVDARDLNIETIVNVASRYSQFETEIDLFMPRSRREARSEYCAPVASMFHEGAYGTTISSLLRDGVDGLLNLDRYYKVNLSAFGRHGTIEFRHHSGTTNAKKITNWIQFCLEFVAASALPDTPGIVRGEPIGLAPRRSRTRIDVSPALTLPVIENDSLFRGISDSVAEYLRARAAEHAESSERRNASRRTG